MGGRGPGHGEVYTEDEMRLLAGLRKGEGRTCSRCRWLSMRGQQRGCFPDGVYRKFLSKKEYESGCEMFAEKQDGPGGHEGR